MFVGHFAAALAAKRAAPSVSLGVQFVACQWLDLVWPVMLLTGVERASIDHDATVVTPLDLAYVPWSHSLVMSVVWSALFFGGMKLARRPTRDAAVVAAVVFSHFVLDVITHRPDMPLAFAADSPRFGFGLWNSLAGTLIVELGMFAGATALYVRATEPTNQRGRWVFVGLIAILSLIYAANILGPKPPEDTPVIGLAGPALGLTVFALLAWWADRNRVEVSLPSSPRASPSAS